MIKRIRSLSTSRKNSRSRSRTNSHGGSGYGQIATEELNMLKTEPVETAPSRTERLPLEKTRKKSEKKEKTKDNEPITQSKLEREVGFSARMMKKGFDCDLFVPIKNGKDFRRQKKMCVYYSPEQKDSLITCPQGKKSNTHDMYYIREITDVYIGKQMIAFQSKSGKSAHEHRCCSLVTQNGELHLEAKSAEELTRWLSGVSNLINSVGRKTVYDTPPPTKMSDM